jgi:enhancing lycopene biosynthesis protein 2
MKCAIILAGCGVYDGAEIHESVMLLYALSLKNAEYEIFAPNIDQFHVVDHLSGQVTVEKRNVLTEAARIARGKICDLKNLNPEKFDAIILPGGFGVAKNLCDFAFKSENMTVLPELEMILKTAHSLGKPIGAMCISPVILAKIFPHAKLTIGNDTDTTKALENMGAIHTKTNQGQVVIDAEHKFVTTPCYMLDASLAQIGQGAAALVDAVQHLIK